MSDAADQLLERIARQRAGMHVGTVVAIDSGDNSVTVDLEVGTVEGVRWITSYVPSLGDVVVVSQVQAMWVVLGALSEQLGAAIGEASIAFAPGQAASFWRDSNFPTSYWLRTTPGPDAFLGAQGKTWTDTTYTVTREHGSIWFMDPPDLPDGAVVSAARLTMSRSGSAGVDLLEPVLWQHGYTPSTWNAATTFPTLTGPEWRPGSLAAGQTGVWPLPSAWLTGWLAGTTKGWAIFSDQFTDYGHFLGPGTASVTVDYTIPS